MCCDVVHLYITNWVKSVRFVFGSWVSFVVLKALCFYFFLLYNVMYNIEGVCKKVWC